MSSIITVRGFVATQPKIVIVGEGLAITNFRLGSTNRRFNRETKQWENGTTSWFSVACFRELATNAFGSVNKGDPVIVSGRLKVSEWSAGEKSGLDVEIEADAVGHDFRFGKAVGFARTGGRQGAKETAQGGQEDEEQNPPDEGEPAEADWAAPGLVSGMSLGSSTTTDAGEPTPLDLGILDEETGELREDPEHAVSTF